MSAVPQYPIEVAKFGAYVQERRKKRILYKGELLVSLFYFIIVFSILLFIQLLPKTIYALISM